MLIRKGILEPRAIERRRNASIGGVQVEIAGEHDRRFAHVSPGILQCLLQLGATQPVISSALKMKVVEDNGFPGDVFDQEAVQLSKHLDKRHAGAQVGRGFGVDAVGDQGGTNAMP